MMRFITTLPTSLLACFTVSVFVFVFVSISVPVSVSVSVCVSVCVSVSVSVSVSTYTNLRSPMSFSGAFQLKHLWSALITALVCVTESLSAEHVISCVLFGRFS